jgi:hypothetical protein
MIFFGQSPTHALPAQTSSSTFWYPTRSDEAHRSEYITKEYIELSIIRIFKHLELVFIHPLIEMSTGNLPGCKGLSALKANNVTAICERIV